VDHGDHAGVAVFCELRNGAVAETSLRLLATARSLADILGDRVYALIPGAGSGESSGISIAAGADTAVVADHPVLADYATLPYTRVVVEMTRQIQPEILLFAATALGRDLAPRVAQRLNTGLTADCSQLTIDPDTRTLHQTKPGYGPDSMVTIATPEQIPQMATVRPGAMPTLFADPGRSGDVVEFAVNVPEEDLVVRLLRSTASETQSITIDTARIIVAGGRGVGSANGFAMLRELAAVLGAELAGSRGAVDNGWIAHDRMVGQTGRSVRPELYLACGISGAIQHRAGIEDAGMIVAINRDPKAPIFAVADYGIVGDLHQILPLLVSELKRPTGN